ncbi:MAG: ABC transporter permease [Clostridiales bacterium]|nr:ABC transporter permease [Clostridiales bacterium]
MRMIALFKSEVHLLLNKFLLIFLIFVSIILSLFAVFPSSLLNGGNIGSISIALVYDKENEEFSRYLTAIVIDSEIIDHLYVANADEADEMLKTGQVQAIAIFPPDIVEQMINHGKAQVTLKSNDAITGTCLYSVLDSTIQTLNQAQDAMLSFIELAKSNVPDAESLYEAEFAFQKAILTEVLLRSDNFDVIRSADAVKTQEIALVLFMIASIISVFVATMTSSQFSSGALRRLRLHKIGIWQTYVIKLMVSLFFAEALALLCCAAFLYIGWEVSYPRFLAGAALMIVSVQSICLFFTTATGSTSGSSKTALGCLAILLFLLFGGGGFYPITLMKYSIQWINPAFLAHLLSEWTLGATFSGGARSMWFALLPAVCVLLTLWKWRRPE